MIFATVDWTNVLDTLIVTVPAIIAAIYAGKIHRKIQTPSGKPIGQQVEHANVTAIANHQLLGAVHGHTKPANGDELREAANGPLQVPAEESP